MLTILLITRFVVLYVKKRQTTVATKLTPSAIRA